MYCYSRLFHQALEGHCWLSIRYLQLDMNKSTCIVKNLRFVIKLMFSCINSMLRSNPIWPGESLWLNQLWYWMLWSLVYSGNMDKQKKEIEDKTQHKRKWIRNWYLIILRYFFVIYFIRILIENTKFPFTFCNCTFLFAK